MAGKKSSKGSKGKKMNTSFDNGFPGTEARRHGDVILYLFLDDGAAEAPKGAKTSEPILAYGEVTGHGHRVSPTGAQVARDEANNVWMTIKAGATVQLTHEEHKTFNLPTGKYRSFQKRQWAPNGRGFDTVAD